MYACLYVCDNLLFSVKVWSKLSELQTHLLLTFVLLDEPYIFEKY